MDLKRLLALQDVDLELFRLRQDIKSRPAALSLDEAAAREAAQDLEKLKVQVREFQKLVDSRNLELKSAEEAVKKLEAQSLTLKSNAEYQTMMKQIAAKKVEISGLEDRILEAMEAVEKARAGLSAKEAAVRERQRSLEVSREKVTAEVAAAQSRIRELDEEWKRMSAALPTETLGLYKYLRDRFGATPVAEISADGVCQGCYMSVTAHRLNDAMAGEMVQCSSCERLLYYAASAG